jgi:hypothetical protein
MGVRLMELALETLEQFLDLNEQLEWVEERLKSEHSQACEGELNEWFAGRSKRVRAEGLEVLLDYNPLV